MTRARIAAQEGFTIIEVMIAAVVILVAIGLVIGASVGIRHVSVVGETKAEASKVAQQELEKLRSLGWEQQQMDAAPSTSTNYNSPLYDGSDTAHSPRPALFDGTNFRPSSDAAWQPLAIGAAPDTGETDLRAVKVTPTDWSSDKSAGKIYRFVTYGDDTACGTACPGTQDYKRITVAVTVTSPSNGIVTPVIVSTQVANPTDTAVQTTTGVGTPPAVKTGLTYYLYDTQAFNTVTTRQTQVGDHNRRDTQVKPDLMGEDPAPDPNCSDAYPSCDPPTPTVVPTYNYTKDTTTAALCPTAAGGNNDCGAGIKKSGSSCVGGGADKEHEWISNVVPTGTEIKLTGNASADLYTQTMTAASLPGRICIAVYDVPGTLKTDGSINGTQTLIGTTQSYEKNPWFTAFDELQFSFRFLAVGATYYTVAAGRRIGIYVTVADHLAAPNGSTTSTDLSLMYDHPDYPSSIGMETQ